MDVSVSQAYRDCKDNTHCVLLDVRTAAECSKGVAKGSVLLPLDLLQDKTATLDIEYHYYVICESGIRSKIAIKQLRQAGFKNVYHINQGFNAWLKAKLPTEIPKIQSSDLRYNRHHLLAGFGKNAQEKLLKSKVLIVGVGGLGSPVALYLAAAGVGHITLVDDDTVSLSNLQRQILHTTNNIGSLKVDSAQQALHALNPEITIDTVAQKLTSDNAHDLIKHVDVVIDGSDNLATRYLVNDICMQYKKTLVYAAVYQYEAQVTLFDFSTSSNPCLKCLFPQTQGFEPENCSTVGVLGVVPGMAGILQASETIKWITAVGEPLVAKLLLTDLRDNSFRTIKYKKDNSCKH